MMKKLLLLIAVITISSTGFAQTNESGVFLEGGLGYMDTKFSGHGLSSDAGMDGIALELGLGYRMTFSPYVAWDILKFRVSAGLGDFEETINPQLLTGIRGITPELFSGMTGYGTLGLGYGYLIDAEKGGFCYEIGVGLNVTSKISAGLTFGSQQIKEHGVKYRQSIFGAKVGYNF